jgi:NADH dehydrogenase FAD-containing subunit
MQGKASGADYDALLAAVRCRVQEHYPDLMKDVKIRIIELMDHVLSTYDRKISEYTAQRFARAGDSRLCLCSVPSLNRDVVYKHACL